MFEALFHLRERYPHHPVHGKKMITSDDTDDSDDDDDYSGLWPLELEEKVKGQQ